MEATLEFLADIPLWKEERPYQIFFKTDGAVSDSNCHFETHSGVHIEDVKALTWKPTLETDGFELVTTHYQKNLSIPNFEDPSKMQSVVIPYLQLTRSFLKSRLGAEDVICFDWRIRAKGRPDKDLRDLEVLDDVRNEVIRPAKVVHIDYSHQGGQFKVAQHLSDDEISKYPSSQWKFQIINIWRPLVPVVQTDPLALCHPQFIEPDDLIEKDNVTNQHTAVGSLYLLYRAGHHWYYADSQTSQEAWVFVSWDMDQDLCCPPHCSFEVPGTSDAVMPRESVEARFIVITKRT